ncbi:MAG TPA: hypothetical protein VI854_08595, partial [Acidimicrobiia bacterium]|nr:hypothetical protein [Acidimicrobiia bacterium]
MGRVASFLSSFVLAAALTALAGAPGVGAQEAGFPVVVFEGQGQGHGVGLPLDGAHALAEAEGADAEEILERFYPGAQKGTGKGLVRLLMAAQDDVTSGIDVLLPEGGTVRDGRTTPVAASFPIRVPAGRTVRITYRQGFYRAEVLDESSVSGTVEITATSAPETGAQGPTSTAPALAA